MKDFGKRVKAAEREAKAKAKPKAKPKAIPPQNRRKRPTPKNIIKPGERLSPETEFKPGVSGNPGGRPKKTPITDAMRKYLAQPYSGKQAKYNGMTNADVLAIKQFELAVDSDDMTAAKEIADRVEGKVTQTNRHEGPNGGAIPFTNLSPEENEAAIAALLAGNQDGDDSAD